MYPVFIFDVVVPSVFYLCLLPFSSLSTSLVQVFCSRSVTVRIVRVVYFLSCVLCCWRFFFSLGVVFWSRARDSLVQCLSVCPSSPHFCRCFRTFWAERFRWFAVSSSLFGWSFVSRLSFSGFLPRLPGFGLSFLGFPRLPGYPLVSLRVWCVGGAFPWLSWVLSFMLVSRPSVRLCCFGLTDVFRLCGLWSCRLSSRFVARCGLTDIFELSGSMVLPTFSSFLALWSCRTFRAF